MLGQTIAWLRAPAASRASRRFGTLGMLIALGLTGFSDQAASDNPISIGPVVTGSRSATLELGLADGVGWADHQTWLNGVEISDLVAAGDGKVELNVAQHPLRYGTNRLRTKVAVPGGDGASRRVDLSLRSFEVTPPVYDIKPRSPLVPIDTRVVLDDPTNVSVYQVRIGPYRHADDQCTVNGKKQPDLGWCLLGPPISLSDRCPDGVMLWFIFLNRKDIHEVKANLAYHSCGGGIGQGVWDLLNERDSNGDSPYLVIVNQLGLIDRPQSRYWDNFILRELIDSDHLNVSGGILAPVQGTYQAWSVVSVPGGMGVEHLTLKNGDQHRAADDTAAANLHGGFALDNQGNYAFMQTDYVTYDTRAATDGGPCGATAAANRIFVAAGNEDDESYCHDSVSLPDGQGGFHVVTFDRNSLRLLSNETYLTNQPVADIAWQEVSFMTAALKRVTEAQLVFIASLGSEPLIGYQNQDEKNRLAGLAFALEGVGATPETIIGIDGPPDTPPTTPLAGQEGTYSLVGTRLSSAADLPESSSVILPELCVIENEESTCTNDNPGRLTGALARGQLNGWYGPLTHQAVAGDMSLARFIGHTTADWPVPAPENLEERAAYDYIAGFMFSKSGSKCPFNAKETRDPRDFYFEDMVADFETCIDQATFPSNNPQPGFSGTIFDRIHQQIDDELADIADLNKSTDGFVPRMESLITTDALESGLVVGDTTNKFKDDPRITDDSQVFGIVEKVVSGIGGILGAAGVPGAGPIAGVINAGLSVASQLTRSTAGGSFTFEQTVEELEKQQREVAKTFSAMSTTFDLQMEMIYGDWGKLEAVSNQWHAKWSSATGTDWDRFASHLSLAYQRHLAQQLTEQFFSALQVGVWDMDHFHDWGKDWNFDGQRADFDSTWDPQTLQTPRPDGKIDVILIKVKPLLSHSKANPNQWKRDRHFNDILTFLTGKSQSEAVSVRGALGADLEVSAGPLGLYTPDIYRRWRLTWNRCDWFGPDAGRPRDCQQYCQEENPGYPPCLRAPGGM